MQNVRAREGENESYLEYVSYHKDLLCRNLYGHEVFSRLTMMLKKQF